MNTLATAIVLCNMQNWTYSPRCMAPVATLNMTDIGFDGHLESGVYWQQYWIDERTMRFRMEEVTWIIQDGKII